METDLNESNKNFLVYSAFYLAYLEEIKGDEGEIKKVRETIEKLKGDEGDKNEVTKLVNEFSEKVKKILNPK